MWPSMLPRHARHPAPSSSDDTHGSTDLSGDSGSIGRLVIGGTKAEPTMQIDLKGEREQPASQHESSQASQPASAGLLSL